MKLLVCHSLFEFKSLHSLPNLFVNVEKYFAIFWHLACKIRAMEDWRHVGPQLLHCFPNIKELYHRLQGFKQAVNLMTVPLGVDACRN